jgi:hypothetical protein
MKKEIYIHDSSPIALHNFTVYATKAILKKGEFSVKFISVEDYPRTDLNQFCSQYLGLSPFTKDKDHKKIVDKLVDVYAYDIMEEIDPQWWIDKLLEQAKTITESIPNLRLFAQGINKPTYSSKLIKEDKYVIGVKLDDIDLNPSIGTNAVVSLSQETKLSKEEDIDDAELDKVCDFLKEIDEE